MQNAANRLGRREFLYAAITTAAGTMPMARAALAQESRGKAIAPFDGSTLNGWLQIENDATALSSGEITAPAEFVSKLASGTDAVSVFLRGQLDEAVKTQMAAFAAADAAAAKAALSALVKQLNAVIAGPSIYD